jgi:hypothetical protein
MLDLSKRHPATQQILRWFSWDHLPARLQAISAPVSVLAYEMAEVLPDGPELTFALRQLLLAKDAFVRAELDRTGERVI